MHNSVHITKVTWNFTLQSTPWENIKLKCSEISTLQNRQIKMQIKYSVLQVGLTVALLGRFCDRGAIYKCPNLLTYLLTYLVLKLKYLSTNEEYASQRVH